MTQKKSLGEGVGRALEILFENPEEVHSFQSLGRQALALPSGSLRHNNAYGKFRDRLRNVPKKILPFWRSYPEVEEKKWDEGDLRVIQSLKGRFSHFQIKERIGALSQERVYSRRLE